MRILQIKTDAPDLQHPDKQMHDVPEGVADWLANMMNELQQGAQSYFITMPDEIEGNLAI